MSCRHVTDRLRIDVPRGTPGTPSPGPGRRERLVLSETPPVCLMGLEAPQRPLARTFVLSEYSGPPSRLITSQGRSDGLQRALSVCSRLACRLPRGYPPSSPASSATVVPVRSTWSSSSTSIRYQSGVDQVVISHRGRAGGKTPPGRIWVRSALALGARRGSHLD